MCCIVNIVLMREHISSDEPSVGAACSSEAQEFLEASSVLVQVLAFPTLFPPAASSQLCRERSTSCQGARARHSVVIPAQE